MTHIHSVMQSAAKHFSLLILAGRDLPFQHLAGNPGCMFDKPAAGAFGIVFGSPLREIAHSYNPR